MVGGINAQGGATYSADSVNQGLPPIPPFSVPIPDCTGMPAITQTSVGPDDVVFTPGISAGGITMNNPTTTFTFQPGLYCIGGNNSFVVNSGIVEGAGVMFYLTGDVSLSGGSHTLSAPTDGSIVDSAGQVWNGMLFFVEGNNDVTINGNVDSTLQGTIYAPDSDCNLNGGGSTTGHDLCLVCDTINVNGGAGLTINYNGANQYEPPTNLDLLK